MPQLQQQVLDDLKQKFARELLSNIEKLRADPLKIEEILSPIISANDAQIYNKDLYRRMVDAKSIIQGFPCDPNCFEYKQMQNFISAFCAGEGKLSDESMKAMGIMFGDMVTGKIMKNPRIAVIKEIDSKKRYALVADEQTLKDCPKDKFAIVGQRAFEELGNLIVADQKCGFADINNASDGVARWDTKNFMPSTNIRDFTESEITFSPLVTNFVIGFISGFVISVCFGYALGNEDKYEIVKFANMVGINGASGLLSGGLANAQGNYSDTDIAALNAGVTMGINAGSYLNFGYVDGHSMKEEQAQGAKFDETVEIFVEIFPALVACITVAFLGCSYQKDSERSSAMLGNFTGTLASLASFSSPQVSAVAKPIVASVAAIALASSKFNERT